MDVRNARIEPTVEHGGTCLTYFMVPKEAWRAETEGSFLEYVSEFELAPGAELEPHRHDTHEFYYLLSGEAVMRIEAEERRVGPGDLVHISRNAVHSIRTAEGSDPFRAFAFAVSFAPPGATYTPDVLPEA